ncbi:soluble quino protein glucose/sorbosone dehydrogenase [Tricladium varicosporioides]|nr:soluble quino protein glucose/sorbosone dehydrogenase [Hymenoscyphus varicosporioides]
MSPIPAFMRCLAVMAVLGLTSAAPEIKKRACASISPKANPTMMSGYTAKVVANGLKTPREIIFDPKGNLLVIEQGGGGIKLITLTDNGGTDVCQASAKTLVADRALNHGLEITPDGKWLFASSVASVFAWPYDAAAGTVGTKKTVVTGMSISGPYHLTRTLRIPPMNPDVILVQRGSDGNIDSAQTATSGGRSQTRIFNIESILATGVDFQSGKLLGWGLRNSVGWGQDPTTGAIWSVENSADDIKKGGKDVHTNNPAEELNYHGLLNDTSSAEFGSNYGYPSCFSVWETSSLGSKVGQQVSIDASVGASTDADCAKKTAPRLVFPAHTAPLDIKFKKDGSAAFVTFHGSWDRSPPDGYRLSKIEFKNGMPVQPSTSTSAAINIMQNGAMGSCPNSCFRPTGLAWDSKDRLFMSSDTTNEIFIIGGV